MRSADGLRLVALMAAAVLAGCASVPEVIKKPVEAVQQAVSAAPAPAPAAASVAAAAPAPVPVNAEAQRAFDADTAVGAPGPGGPPGYDSAEWHQAALGWGQVFSITHAEEIVGGAIVFLQSPTQARLARI